MSADHSDREYYLSKIFRRSKSKASKKNVRIALQLFDRIWGKTCEDVAVEGKRGRISIYKVIDDYSGKLSDSGLSPASVAGYITRLVQYFRYLDVTIDRDTFRSKVTLPRIEEPDDRAPSVEEIERMLAHADTRGRALILLLTSSGVRIGEALKLKVGDIEFSEMPVRIKVSSRVATKTGMARETFMTDETASALKEHLGDRASLSDSFLFPSPKDPNMALSDDTAQFIMNRITRKIGLKETTSTGRRKVHLHSLRKFFFTKSVGVIGETAAHALMGHSIYMGTYYRKDRNERRQEYLHCAPYLAILKREAIGERKEAVLEALRRFAEPLGVDPMRIRIEKQKEVGKVPSTDEEISLLQNEIKKIRRPRDNLQTIVKEGDLEGRLTEGWQFVSILPSKKILIRR